MTSARLIGACFVVSLTVTLLAMRAAQARADAQKRRVPLLRVQETNGKMQIIDIEEVR